LADDFNIDQVRELVKLVEKHNLAELTVEEEGLTINIKGVEKAASQTPVFATIHAPIEHASEVTHREYAEEDTTSETAEQESEDANLLRIESPMIGVFYRSASPDSPPFVEIGDTIEVGQPVGLIEAMKVFSEIPSEIAGVVVDIPAENAKLVHQGDVLIVVRGE
jgi:acetyl-CoA carboxylase biotin carboxyl carrier protein